jgi:hypothetical protein
MKAPTPLENRISGSTDECGFVNSRDEQTKTVPLTREQTGMLVRDIIEQRVLGKTYILEEEPWFAKGQIFYTYILGNYPWWDISTTNARTDIEVQHQKTAEWERTHITIYWNRNTKKRMDDIERNLNALIEKYLKLNSSP